MTEDKEIIERSSGNVFADLGLEDAEELMTRAMLGSQVRTMLEERNLKQREIADLFGIPQPEVSRLMNGEYNRFSEGKLMHFLNKLDCKITLQISPHNPGERFQEVVLKGE